MNKFPALRLGTESIDCSLILSHLIRQDGRTDSDAKNLLKKILALPLDNKTKPCLKAKEIGYYNSLDLEKRTKIYTKKLKGYNPSSNNKAICFTESTLQGLEAHNSVYNAKYGVSFKREILFSKGANPAINIRDDLLNKNVECILDGNSWNAVKNHIPEPLIPFINIINTKFDATHEREWRVPSDMQFEYSDLFIVFCPENDFKEFKSIQTDAVPILFDLSWLKFV